MTTDHLIALRRRALIASRAARAQRIAGQVQVPLTELEHVLALVEQLERRLGDQLLSQLDTATGQLAGRAEPQPGEPWRSPLHRTYVHDPRAHLASEVDARVAKLNPLDRELALRTEEDRGRDSLLSMVKRECARHDQWPFHAKNAMHSSKGFPDLHILGRGPGRLMYRELKKERGRVTPDQVAALEWLNANGFDADVWRPSDWFSQRIQRELAALAGEEYSPW
jgi:hypothetical protein